MEVILARPRGFCAGVIRAIQIVEHALKTQGAPVYVLHEIVHNRHVLEELKQKGAYFAEKFRKYSLSQVRDLRQFGLIIGIELKQKSYPFILELQKRGILVLPAGATVIRLLPPLTISYNDLDLVIREISDCLK